MYLRRLRIRNVRRIEDFVLSLGAEECPGWHVLLGANGAGKSSVVRSLALALAGPKEAGALRQAWATWTRNGAIDSLIEFKVDVGPEDIFTGTGKRTATVEAQIDFRPVESAIGGPRVEIASTSARSTATRSVWGTNAGWFSASFGPFRRFTGGDQAFDRLFYSNPKLAPHLSAFGEDVALTEGLRWLRELRVKQLEESKDESQLLDALVQFLNQSDLLPHGASVTEVRSEEVVILDADGSKVAVEQMSDGYRSVLSMIFEILRQMTKAYGIAEVLRALDMERSQVNLPGVVAIDEVDAHLHPSWQAEIGPWFTRCFPRLQFIVTTHSPIICRSAKSVWHLASPGSDEPSGRVEGVALARLLNGSILEAYGTDLFGEDITRSKQSQALLEELAALNRKALRGALDEVGVKRMEDLRSVLPTRATDESSVT